MFQPLQETLPTGVLAASSLSRITEPAPENNFENRLFFNSFLGQGKPFSFFLISQAVFFIAVNIAVNLFSFEENYGDNISTITLIFFYVGIIITTAYANAFSRVTPSLKDPIRGLNLSDEAEIRFCKAFEETLAIIPNSLQTTVMIAIDVALSPFRNHFSENSALLGNAPEIISEKLTRVIQLLKTHYSNTYGKELIVFDRRELLQRQQNFYGDGATPLPQQLFILTNFQPKNNEIDPRTHFVHVDTLSISERLWQDIKNKSLRSFSSTVLEKFGYAGLWVICKGFPGFVVMCTSTVALSKVERVAYLESRGWRGLIFFANFLVSFLGKTLINNKLKGNDTLRELRKIIAKITYRQPLFDCDIQYATLAMTVSFFSVYILLFCTAWFYTVEGLQSALNEINYIFDSNFVFSPTVKNFIIISSTITSFLISHATGTVPFYNYLKRHGDSSSNRGTSQPTSAAKKFLDFSIVCDNCAFGNNAKLNVSEVWNYLRKLFDSFDQFSNNFPFMQNLCSYTVGLGITILYIAFCLEKANPNFEQSMRLVKTIFGFSSRPSLSQNPYRTFSSHAALNDDDADAAPDPNTVERICETYLPSGVPC